MEDTPKIIITLIKKKMFYESCEIFNSSYNFNKMKNNKLIINIPNEKFSQSKEKILVEIKLISKYDSIKFNFNAYYGINKAYCFLSSFKHSIQLYEFYFYKQIKVKYDDGDLTEMDSFENDSRSRIILINAPNNITFNEISFNIGYFQPPKNPELDSLNSFEVAVFDILKYYFASKVIQKKEKISIIENIKMFRNNLENFYINIKTLYNEKEDNIDKYSSIINESKIIEIEINFSQKKSTLENEFKDNQDYYIMYLYLLWFALGAYCLKIKKEKENKKENEYLSIRDIFRYTEKLYIEYQKDEDLLTYQKIMLIYSNILFLLTFPNIKKYEDCKLKYIKRKDIKSKSVFGISFHFLEEFIEKLNSKSYLFYPLLLLDCGLYQTKEREPIYGFNLETCSHLKSHLKELIPDVFFIYEEKFTSLKTEGGFNFKGYGIIFINALLSLKEYKYDPICYEYNNKEEERINKHFGMRVSKLMMHESFCHNKFIFEHKNGDESPCNFYNSEMNLIKIVPINYPNYDNNYLRGSKEYGKGESGKFFEYFFGLYFNHLIIDLLYEVKYIGKLIDNVEYFLKEKLDVIKDYIICKYQIKEKKIKYNDNNDLTLEDEIKTMKNLIESHKFSLIEEKKIKNTIDNNNINKNSDILFGFKFIEEIKQEKEYKGYSYYLKKAKEAKSSEEFFKYSSELIFNHLKTE